MKLFVLWCAATAATAAAAATTPSARISQLPLTFEKNVGQADSRIDFLSRDKGFTFGLSSSRAWIAGGGSEVEMRLDGARAGAIGEALEPLSSHSNYFLGRDRTNWHANVPHFGKVRYRSVYPGIDVIYHATAGALEYDFIVAPGKDARRISLKFTGTRTRVAENGDLVLTSSEGELRQHKPVAYQEISGRKRPIDARYKPLGTNRYGFTVGPYDRSIPLVIDPSLAYATYVGGMNSEDVDDIVVDSTGNVYLSGTTTSPTFPQATKETRIGPRNGGSAFVAKLNATGTALSYVTYVGAGAESSAHLAVDGAGNAYVAGFTYSRDFPNTFNMVPWGDFGSYAFKLNPSGSALVYSNYISWGYHSPVGVVVNSAGELYIAGTCGDLDYPVTGDAYQGTHYEYDVYVSAVSATGYSLTASTLLGGSKHDVATTIAFDASGRVIVGGVTDSPDFPTTSGAHQRVFGGTRDGFVAVLNSSLTTLVASTLLGGAQDDTLSSVAADATGIYIAGITSSSQFPFTTTATLPRNDFAAKLTADLATVAYAVPVNGRHGENGCYLCGPSIAVDSQGWAYISGVPADVLPTTTGALQALATGNDDQYLVRLNAAGTLTYATTLGGSGPEWKAIRAVAVDGARHAYIAGYTGSFDFPTTPNALQRVNFAPSLPEAPFTYVPDAFVARIDFDDTVCTVTASRTSIDAGSSTSATYVDIITPAGCPWSAHVESASWLHVAGHPGGTGSDHILVIADTNTDTTPRDGTVNLSWIPIKVHQAGASCVNKLAADTLDAPASGASYQISVSASGPCTWSATSNSDWITVVSVNVNPSTSSGTVVYRVDANNGGARTGTMVVAGQTFTVNQSRNTSLGLRFIPIVPCRVADTRDANGPLGGPALASGAKRDFAVPSSACGVPATAWAYSLNVTAVPRGALSFLTIWPAGEAQPVASTLNSLDGRIKANAAIVAAGTSGAVSVYAAGSTDVVLDINGYFVPASNTSAYAFHPLSPCRLADSRTPVPGSGVTQILAAGSVATLNALATPCPVPPFAVAYSLNFTAVPKGSLPFITVWPAGGAQPTVSTLNALEGNITANAAIVPAGNAGAIAIYAHGTTDLVIDINGYFSADFDPDPLALYLTPPCRVDTRVTGPALTGARDFALNSTCSIPASAKAFSMNATVVPRSTLSFLTLYPASTARPLVSTLNALDGNITSNAAIVPTSNGSITAFTTDTSDLVLDIAGYFAP